MDFSDGDSDSSYESASNIKTILNLDKSLAVYGHQMMLDQYNDTKHGISLTFEDLNADCVKHILEFASSFPGWKYRRNNIGWCRQLNTAIYDNFEPSLVKYRNGRIDYGTCTAEDDFINDDDVWDDFVRLVPENPEHDIVIKSEANGLSINLNICIFGRGYMVSDFVVNDFNLNKSIVESRFVEKCPYSPDSYCGHEAMLFQDHNVSFGGSCDCNWCICSNSIKFQRYNDMIELTRQKYALLT
jgi:hypothetical protein